MTNRVDVMHVRGKQPFYWCRLNQGAWVALVGYSDELVTPLSLHGIDGRVWAAVANHSGEILYHARRTVLLVRGQGNPA